MNTFRLLGVSAFHHCDVVGTDESVLKDESKLGGYPAQPIVELGQWKKHYPGQGGSRHNKRGGGGRGGGGRGGGRGGRGGRGRGH